MARLKGKLLIEGTLDDLSFYKTQDGIVVRRKWGPDKKRMKRDPAFEAVRAHGKEFGAAARHSSLLRGALRNLIKDVSDNRVTGRMNKLLMDLTKLDEGSQKGERKLHTGIQHSKADELLGGFEINIHCQLKDHLLNLPPLTKKKEHLYIDTRLTKKDMVYPKGATHAELKAGWLRIDFESGVFQMEESNAVVLEHKVSKTHITLKTSHPIEGKGKDLFILRLAFLKKTAKGLEELGNEFKAAALFILV